MKRVAIQGVKGCFHEIAAREFFQGEEIDAVECETFEELFETVKREGIIATLAIENTIAGSLLQNHILLKESGLKIAGEQKIRIRHNLVAMPGQELESIKEVYSHPIALMQIRNFLEDHKFLKAVEWDDTASSAKMIAREQAMGKAGVCSEWAAEIYGLEILAKGIETNKRNFTRFLVISDPWTVDEIKKDQTPNKASLVFRLPHDEGSLARVLSIMSYYGMNLTKIQSMPIIGREWEYEFYVDLRFEDYLKYKQSLEAFQPLTLDLIILGEYREGRQTI
ncbi:MAG: prephenate dehydratase [Bacteroidales bacterium]|nr:prephenate dehydratase [Candidatus Scybalocola fimicaballi]MCQ2190215.1 prephenate dehydratase [Paludibacteraceae bacterium]